MKIGRRYTYGSYFTLLHRVGGWVLNQQSQGKVYEGSQRCSSKVVPQGYPK